MEWQLSWWRCRGKSGTVPSASSEGTAEGKEAQLDMKVLELRFDGDPGRRVNLHPNVTVVRGLASEPRQLLVDSLADLPHGYTTGVSGLIEARGVLFDLTSEALRLLGLESDVDAVVRGADLPVHDREARASAERVRHLEGTRDHHAARLVRAQEAASAVADARRRLLASIDAHHRRVADAANAMVHAATALARARQERRRTQAETNRLRADLDEARARHEELVGGREAAAEAVAEARLGCERAAEATARAAGALDRAGEDTAAAADTAAVERLRAKLAHLTAEAAQTAEATAESRSAAGEETTAGVAEAPPDGYQEAHGEQDSDAPGREAVHITDGPVAKRASGDALRTRTDHPEAQAERLRQQLVALDTAAGDMASMQAARDRLDRAERVVAPPEHQRALALADRWRQIGRELDALGRDPGDDDLTNAEPAAVSTARSRLAQARRAVNDAKGASVPSTDLGPDDVAALEEAHTTVLDAQERTEGRFGVAKAQRRLEAARAAERTVLDRLGFSTYADYMMSASNRYVGAADQAVRETAMRSVSAAERVFAAAWREAYGEEPGPDAEAGPPPEPRLRATTPDSAQQGAEKAWPTSDQPTDEASGAGLSSEVRMRREELHRRRDELRREAADLLDHPPGDDVAAELDALVGSASRTVDPAGRELSQALLAAGIAVDDHVDRDALVVLADAWLGEQQLSSRRKAELGAELKQVEANLVRAWDVRAAPHHVGRAPTEGAVAATIPADVAVGGGAEAGRTRSTLGRGPFAANAPGDRSVVNDGALSAALVTEARRALAEAEASVAARETADPLAEHQALLEVRRAEQVEATEALRRAEAALTGESDPAQAPATEAVGRAQATLRQAEAAERDADHEVTALESDAAGADRSVAAALIAELESRLQAVNEEHQRAVAEVAAATTDLESAERAARAEAQAETDRRQDRAHTMIDRSTLVEDIDWYLLSRLASQRSISVAGSVPLVLDDPFVDLRPEEGTWLLSRLERMTEAVQVILVSDSPEAAAWVATIGDERGAVVGADAA